MKESFDDIVIKWEVIGREMFASHQGRRVCFEVYRQPLLRIVLSVEDVMQLWKNKSKNAMTSCRHYMLQVLISGGVIIGVRDCQDLRRKVLARSYRLLWSCASAVVNTRIPAGSNVNKYKLKCQIIKGALPGML